MSDKYELIGPCSKFIQGRGWVTVVTEKQLNAIGFIKAQPIIKPEPTKPNKVETK